VCDEGTGPDYSEAIGWDKRGRMGFGIAGRVLDGRDVVEVTGDVDIKSSAELRDAVTSLVEAGSRSIVIDLTHVSFMDSTGLSALVGAHGSATKNGAAIALVLTDANLLRLLRITSLDTAFAVHPNLEMAVTGLSGGA
jgi:anti-sigma B factor antagonist